MGWSKGLDTMMQMSIRGYGAYSAWCILCSVFCGLARRADGMGGCRAHRPRLSVALAPDRIVPYAQNRFVMSAHQPVHTPFPFTVLQSMGRGHRLTFSVGREGLGREAF
ncbi:hypothetical protein EJ07DRAFT_159884 [Lizonia empirigonia]|nr:hypothetical protein EJ07DRAFT_159884 [Lizonia empirigonia]